MPGWCVECTEDHSEIGQNKLGVNIDEDEWDHMEPTKENVCVQSR